MKCIFCSNNEITKAGKRYNKYETKQVYKCKKCKRKFVEDDGFRNMTYPKEIVAKVLHLRVEGLSLSKVREYIWQHEGYRIYDGTILYWEKKYSQILSKFESKLKPKVKGCVHTDEVVVKVKGKQYRPINSIDSKTKYNLAVTFTEHRTKEKCREHFKKLNDKIGEQVRKKWEKERNKPKEKRKLITFISDKFEGFKIGFNYYFYRAGKLVHGVPIACKKYGLKYNNNSIERHNEDYKQRYKITRGFKNENSAKAFTELRRIVYNFVRTHQSIGKTPAEEAGLNIGLGRNRLLSLIFFLYFYSLPIALSQIYFCLL